MYFFSHHQVFLILLILSATSVSITQASDDDTDSENGLQSMDLGKMKANGVTQDEQDFHSYATSERELWISSTAPCKSGAGTNYYFKITFTLTTQGGWDTSACTSSRKKALGNAVNAFLLNYGIGTAGIGDKISFLGEVCNKPTTSSWRRRERDRRELLTWNFSFYGGGPCRYCLNDNFDARRTNMRGLLYDEEQRALQTYDPATWFNNIFKPEMQNTLRNKFTTDVAPYHTQCLGNGPTVGVTIRQVSSMPTTSC